MFHPQFNPVAFSQSHDLPLAIDGAGLAIAGRADRDQRRPRRACRHTPLRINQEIS